MYRVAPFFLTHCSLLSKTVPDLIVGKISNIVTVFVSFDESNARYLRHQIYQISLCKKILTLTRFAIGWQS